MQRFDLSLPTPAQNLAFDEALLEWAEEGSADGEYLATLGIDAADGGRRPLVARREGSERAVLSRRAAFPILRRSSGGAAIVTGPGCLMYALVLSYAVRPELKDITRAHSFILKQLTTSLGPLLSHAGTITCAGTSDLAICASESRQRLTAPASFPATVCA